MARDLGRVLDAVLDGVVVLDAEGRVEWANSEASRILETSGSTARGTPIDLLLGPDHSIGALARGVLHTGRTAIETERAVERRFDSDVVVDAACSPLFDDDGKISGVVVALRDRTIQSQLEAVVSERERLAAFGRIAAGIAHEVKNPLGGIRGAAEILAARASDAKNHDAAELIVREVDRICSLVDDLMVFARGDELRLAPVNIHQLLDEVLELVCMDPLSEGVELLRSFDPSIPDLIADGDRLTQVFLNLSRNALQAMEKGQGCLSISTRMTLDHRIATSEGERVPTLMVRISDNGAGMSRDVLDKLATPFFTTRPGGTGLGLAVASHWVTRHGGALAVDSRPGAGTTVRVALPLRPPQ